MTTRRTYTQAERILWNAYLRSIGEDEIGLDDTLLWDTLALENWQQVTETGDESEFYPPQDFIDLVREEFEQQQSS